MRCAGHSGVAPHAQVTTQDHPGPALPVTAERDRGDPTGTERLLRNRCRERRQVRADGTASWYPAGVAAAPRTGSGAGAPCCVPASATTERM